MKVEDLKPGSIYLKSQNSEAAMFSYVESIRIQGNEAWCTVLYISTKDPESRHSIVAYNEVFELETEKLDVNAALEIHKRAVFATILSAKSSKFNRG